MFDFIATNASAIAIVATGVIVGQTAMALSTFAAWAVWRAHKGDSK